jgi:anti-anti-sigma regulatory factor
MGIQTLPEGFILVTLPQKPHLDHELQKINEIAYHGRECDVIIDFSAVQMLTSSSICNLLLLRDFLSAFGRRVFLCSLSLSIKCVFIRLGLETLFEFADHKSAVLQARALQTRPAGGLPRR